MGSAPRESRFISLYRRVADEPMWEEVREAAHQELGDRGLSEWITEACRQRLAREARAE